MYIEPLLIKHWLLRRVERLGFHLQPMRRFKPVDAREHEGNPLLLSYRHPGRRLLLNAPVEWGFGLLNYPFDRPRPLVGVIPLACANPGEERQLIRNALDGFYRAWQPSCAAEFFGLDPDEAGELALLPPWLSAWPWDPLGREDKRAQRRRTEGRENARILGKALCVESGWKFCGPVGEEKLHVETERLTRVLASVRARGVCRHDGLDGDIRAIVLSHPDGRWRWQVLAGQHRYAVISALGDDRIAIRVEQIIRREEVMFWPGVVSGVFTPEAALKVFDDCFAGRALQPSRVQRLESRGQLSEVSDERAEVAQRAGSHGER